MLKTFAADEVDMVFKPAGILVLAGAIASGSLPGAQAADLFGGSGASLLRTQTISAEADIGYLTGTSREYVYDTSKTGSPKLSQLTWSLGHSLAVGGRVAFRPLDWLSVRARGWSTVTSDGWMRDYDWLGGYRGFNSYTDYSYSPDTVAVAAWQGDASIAATFYQDEEVALTAIAGYRHLTTKWNSKGGRYLYSQTSFRDTSGSFQPGQIGVAYQQDWDTPYLGLGVAYTMGDWTGAAEAIGSPLVMARSKDHHALRNLVIKDAFEMSSMFGVSGSLEYAITPGVSAVGRAEYQRYFGARGDATYVYGGGPSFLYAKGAGAEADNVLLTLGVKARL